MKTLDLTVLKVHSQIDLTKLLKTETRFDGACSCGDSLWTIETVASDHGTPRPLYIAWCMDCQKICAYAVEPR